MRKLIIAPFELHQKIIHLIKRETETPGKAFPPKSLPK
jgi:hypothetical protein